MLIKYESNNDDIICFSFSGVNKIKYMLKRFFCVKWIVRVCT